MDHLRQTRKRKRRGDSKTVLNGNSTPRVHLNMNRWMVMLCEDVVLSGYIRVLLSSLM